MNLLSRLPAKSSLAKWSRITCLILDHQQVIERSRNSIEVFWEEVAITASKVGVTTVFPQVPVQAMQTASSVQQQCNSSPHIRCVSWLTIIWGCMTFVQFSSPSSEAKISYLHSKFFCLSQSDSDSRSSELRTFGNALTLSGLIFMANIWDQYYH